MEELKQKVINLEKIVQEQQQFILSLQKGYSIPREFDQAIRERLFSLLNDISVSSTAFNAFTIEFTTPDDGALQAAGAPDKLLEITINGVTYKIPSYT